MISITYAENTIELHLLASIFISICSLAAFGYLVNDLSDITSDMKSNKTNLIGQISLVPRLILPFAFLLLSFLPLIWNLYNVVTIIILLSNFILASNYSLKPFRLKEKGLVGVLADALGVHTLPVIFIISVFYDSYFISYQESIVISILILWAIITGIRGILLHQILDIKNDKLSDTKTFATNVGIIATKKIISKYIYPAELVVFLILLIFLFDTTPQAGVLFIIYFLYEILNYAIVHKEQINPLHVKNNYILLHFFYEVWMPLIFLISLVFADTIFLYLLGVHIILFYPELKRQFENFLQNLKEITKLLARKIKFS